MLATDVNGHHWPTAARSSDPFTTTPRRARRSAVLIGFRRDVDLVGPGLALLAWSESLRNPVLASRFADLFAQIRTDLTEIARKNQGAGNLPPQVPAEALAAVFLSVVPGCILQLATLGSAAVDGVPAAVEALWP